MRRLGLWLTVTAATIAIAAGAVGCGARDDTRGAAATSFGRMAGYVWSGAVTSVRAAWSVPKMAPGAGEAHASTWIGAQALGMPAPPAFIQVGTTEDRARASGPVYAAFWTDTKRGYHPQILFRIAPGDEVSCSLALVAGRWRVQIVDGSSGRRAAFDTREEGDAVFNLAEWLQEDPSETSGRATPYPALSPIRITHLAADGRPPRYAAMYAQWMSVAGANLAPTPVRDGAFSITRGVITPAGRRYLQLARPQNVAARRIDREEASWSPRTSLRRVSAASAAAAASERTYAEGLVRGHWPVAARGPVSSLARQVRREARMFAAAARRPQASLEMWQRRLARLTPELLRLAHRVRRALRLPELVSGQLPRAAAR
jgi:peptidase A4-like protein